MGHIAEEQMRKHALMCEDAIAKNDPNKMVDHTTAIARLANRVLQVAKQEADNSEDPSFIASISRAADQLQSGNCYVFCSFCGGFMYGIIIVLFCSRCTYGPGCQIGCSQYKRFWSCVTLARIE